MTRDELVEAVAEALYLSDDLEKIPPGTDWEHVVAAAAVDIAEPLIRADERARAVGEFVDRMSVIYRTHSADAVREDARFAVAEFGVDPVKVGWPVEWIDGSE